jgi:hypothetical protein
MGGNRKRHASWMGLTVPLDAIQQGPQGQVVFVVLPLRHSRDQAAANGQASPFVYSLSGRPRDCRRRERDDSLGG